MTLKDAVKRLVKDGNIIAFNEWVRMHKPDERELDRELENAVKYKLV